MIRTAHMPVPQEVLDLADELGMMIYDEWSMCFVTGIDKAVFEKNNLKELAGFVAADHNHPSVVMWSLGNEVSHKLDPELPGQLDKQYDLVRELDLQKRPICSFAGLGDTELYGSAKLKTDVIDIHCYIGMTDSWTLARQVGDLYYRQLAGIYGDGKTFEKPYIISECVGGGWGYAPDPGYRSNVPGYLEQMRRPFHWGQPVRPVIPARSAWRRPPIRNGGSAISRTVWDGGFSNSSGLTRATPVTPRGLPTIPCGAPWSGIRSTIPVCGCPVPLRRASCWPEPNLNWSASFSMPGRSWPIRSCGSRLRSAERRPSSER